MIITFGFPGRLFDMLEFNLAATDGTFNEGRVERENGIINKFYLSTANGGRAFLTIRLPVIIKLHIIQFF